MIELALFIVGLIVVGYAGLLVLALVSYAFISVVNVLEGKNK